jgi:aldose 1-epimerase
MHIVSLFPVINFHIIISIIGNLSGNCHEDLSTHDLYLACDHYLPLTQHQIPTGEIASVQTFPLFDFTEKKKLDKLSQVDPGNDRSGIDHCFIVNDALKIPEYTYNYDVKDQMSRKKEFLRYVGTLSHESSGRELAVYTTQPGVQIYTSNYLSLEKEKSHPFIQHNAICLETQHFPDAINHSHFPTVVLQGNGAESPYYHKSVFSFCAK